MAVWLVLLMQIGIVFLLDHVPRQAVWEQHLLTGAKLLLTANCAITVIRLTNYGHTHLLQNTNLGLNLLLLLLLGYWSYRQAQPAAVHERQTKR